MVAGAQVEGLADKLFGLLGAVAGPAWKAMPAHWRREAVARLGDVNALSVIIGNHDLIRAARIAWVTAARDLIDAEAKALEPEPGQSHQYEGFAGPARKRLAAIRFAAFDRRTIPEQMPIDVHLEAIVRGAAERLADGAEGETHRSLDASFAALLAELADIDAGSVPAGLLERATQAQPRTFGQLVFAAFAELLKRDYPEAGVAFQIDMALATRRLAEQVLERVAAQDTAVVALRQDIAALSNTVASLVQRAHEAWLGIPLHHGTSDPVKDRRLIANRPSWLVVARYRVVPFLDRGGLLAEALAWARGTPSAAEGRLYVAPGGYGKTRLGIELVATLAAEGWRCGFLSASNAFNLLPGPLAQLMIATDARGILLVLDYAEAQVARLRQVAHAARNAPEGAPIRILALARSAEGWWEAAKADADIAAIFAPAPMETADAPLPDDERAALYKSALAAMTKALADAGIDPGPVVAVPPLAGRGFDRPLMVAMAAYLAARGTSVAGGSVLSHMFEEERRHWMRATGATLPSDPRVVTLHRLAAQVTLVQGATRVGPAALLAADPRVAGLDTLAREAALAVMETLYGDRNGEVAFLRPIEPDLVGEHAAMAALADDPYGLASATLHVALAVAALFARNMLTVLERSMRPEHDPSTLKAAAASLRAIEADVAKFEAPAIRRFEASLSESSVPLAFLALAVAQRVAATSDTRQEEARALNNLANRLRATGDYSRALSVARRAVTIHEDLSRANPAAAYKADLAGSLNNLANSLSDTGDREGALAPARRAVDLYEDLASADPAVYLPPLAGCLSNLANRLSDTGDLGGALAPALRAVAIREDLARADPTAYPPDLAASLNNLANRLDEIGDHGGALAPARRAVAIRVDLARANPAAYLPDLGASLNNLAIVLHNIGDGDSAMDPALRAVAIREGLAHANPAAYLPDLAASLGNLAGILSKTGDSDGALLAVRRAVTINEDLVHAHSAAYLPALAASQGMAGDVAARAGDLAGAVEQYANALATFRTCFEGQPQRFSPHLQETAERLRGVLATCGREGEALEMLHEILGEDIFAAMEAGRTAPPPTYAARDASRLLMEFIEAWNSDVRREQPPAPSTLQLAQALEGHLRAHAADAGLAEVRAEWEEIVPQIRLRAREEPD